MIEIFEDMDLQIVVKATIACSVNIRARYVADADGVIRFLNETKIISGAPFTVDGAENIVWTERLPKGELLDLVITTPTPDVQRGQLAIKAGFLRQNFGTTPFLKLIAGYLTTFVTLDLNSPSEKLISGIGFNNIILGTLSGAGAIAELNFPPNLFFRINSFFVTFITSAAVANRKVYLLHASTNQIFSMSAVSQVASLTYKYSFNIVGAPNSSSLLAAKNIIDIIPSDIFIQGGDVINVQAENMDGGDNFTVANVNVEQWLID